MSRVSRKSELSPSITKGSNAIDLGKNSGVDMGGKAQPSVTSGGIGITQEVTRIGGASVSAGVNVDLTPVDFGISVNPSEGTVSVATGAEIPGGLLGISGGIEIDTNTGRIVGGSLGGEIGGLGINVSNSEKGGLGVEISLQIPGTPISLSLGLGFPPEEPKLPTIPGTGGSAGDVNPNPNNLATSYTCSDGTEYKLLIFGLIDIGEAMRYYNTRWENETLYAGGINYTPCTPALADEHFGEGNWVILYDRTDVINAGYGGSSWFDVKRGDYATPPNDVKAYFRFRRKIQYFCYNEPFYTENLIGFSGEKTEMSVTLHEVLPPPPCPLGENPSPNFPGNGGGSSDPSQPNPSQPNPPQFPAFPNPPPRILDMDTCCRESIKLQRLIVRHLGAERNTPKEDLPDGVTAIGSNQEGINQAFPFSVKKQWINPTAKENETIKILNDRQLALVLGGMIERLERTLGTAEFYKDSDRKLRQSEGNMLSWLTGKNKDFRYPDPNDFWVNTDDGIINEKVVEVRSIADGLRYQIEALNRLERILPIAELKDSSIPARWIYPNGKGQLRVGNLIHLCEYMIRKSDKDMGYFPQKITIKAANPAIKDDEPITSDVHSVADMLRIMLQQILDIEGDGDMGSNYDLRRTYLDIMAFQLTAKNNKYLQAITEYLGFDIIEEVSKIPIPFDPFAGQNRSMIEQWWAKYGFGEEKTNFPTKNTESEIERLSGALLQNSELEVNTIKFGSVDAKKDPKTLKEALLEIVKHCSASAAAVTEVATESALDRVVDAAGIAQKLASFLMRRDIRESLGIGDLDAWMTSAEKGYTDNLGTESLRFPESDPFEPYGRPQTQNPAIREIDTKEDKAD